MKKPNELRKNLIKQIPLKNAPIGMLPFSCISKRKKDKRQIIILNDTNDLYAFYTSISMFDNEYIMFDPDDDIKRNDILKLLVDSKKSLITTEDITKIRFPIFNSMKKTGLILERGLEIDIKMLIDLLDNKGFIRNENVYERGEYAIRGFIIDIYGFLGEPVRIELMGDNIESIRIFNIETQTSITEIKKYIIAMPCTNEKESFEAFFKDFTIYNINDILLKNDINNRKYENLVFPGNALNEFRNLLNKYSDYKINVFSTNEYEAQRIKILFKNKVELYHGLLYGNFIDKINRSIYLNDYDIFGKERISINDDYDGVPIAALDDIEELEPGDLVVHREYGIGRFAGIERINLGSRYTDCLKIFYRSNDKLFVPIENIHLVDKYYAVKTSNVKLSPLSKDAFKKRKEGIKISLKEIAGELIRIYAERQMIKGYSFPNDNKMQIEMEEKFHYQETIDQISAIEDVKKDMMSNNAMERLVCGEVGYGKTEVAARAIFKAANDLKQSAFIVPTTILAEQHYRTLKERFKEYSISVEMLSRFRTTKERKGIIEKLKNGDIDVIIGTHTLFSEKMEYNDLRLVIIDEEHRFGVRQKDKLKEIKRNIDILYMSATPIPRTLEMVFSGIKDISNITTPPIGRKPVKTDIINWDDNIIRNAIINEINRGGQIYFVHNRIGSLKSIEEKLKKIVPEVKIVTIHAKLPSSYLEKTMIDFWENKFDLLLSTAIIESGIDNPNTNTMFINQGDRFGIAQLHQLRGRIGRSHNDAFCYVIIPKKNILTKNARLRLSAFKSFPSLGAGMKLALKDLEIRGAGNLLGVKQHGNIGIVGFTMYYKMLKTAIDELKGIRKPYIIEPTINIDLKTYIPNDFPLTVRGKTKLYREIAKITKLSQFSKEKSKFRDRYGKVPEEINNIFLLQKIRIMCKEAKISKISIINNNLKMEFFANYMPSKTVINQLLMKIECPFRIKYENPFGIILKSNKKDNSKFITKLLKSII